MKKYTSTLLTLFLVAVMLLSAACGNAPTVIATPTPAPAESAVDEGNKPVLSKDYVFTAGTSSSGGAVYGVGSAVCQMLNEKITGLDITAVSTGGAVDNVGLMSRDEVQFSFNAANINYRAANGKLSGMDAQDNIRGIVCLYPSIFHFLVSKNSGITGFDQLAGTSIAIGEPGGAGDMYTQDLLGYFGYDYHDREDFKPIWVGVNDAVELMKDGHIEATLQCLGVPGAAVTELAMNDMVNILPISGSNRDDILSQYNYFVPYTIPGGTYAGMDEDIDTIGCTITMVVDESVDEEVVYEVTRAIWENIDELKSLNANLSWMNMDNAIQGLGVPLHPGAERYYKEIGLL